MFSHVLRISLCVFSLAPLAVHAANAQPFELSATSAEDFRNQAIDLRSEMASGGKYSKLSATDQARVGKQLDRLQSLYDKRGEGDKINNADQVALINSTEEINSVLSGNEDDRLVCEQVRKLGSNRTQKVCMTVAERKDASARARKSMIERRSNVYDTRTEMLREPRDQ